ncbi:hypothetical protein THAOC_18954, partial [Thalassiosira oceanica]
MNLSVEGILSSDVGSLEMRARFNSNLTFVSIEAFRMLKEEHEDVLKNSSFDVCVIDEVHNIFEELFRHSTWASLKMISLYGWKLVALSATINDFITEKLAGYLGISGHVDKVGCQEYVIPDVAIRHVRVPHHGLLKRVTEFVKQTAYYDAASKSANKCHIVTSTRDDASDIVRAGRTQNPLLYLAWARKQPISHVSATTWMVERMSSPLRWIRDRFGTDGDASRRQDAAAGNSRASRSAASAASSQPSPDASGRPLTQVGASPFDRSLADSTVGGSTAAGPSPQHASAVGGIHGGAPTVNEFDEALRQDFEGGDGGDSDEEGAEVDVLDNPELRLYPHLLHRNGPRPPGTDPTDIDLDPNDEGHESTNSSSTSAIEGAPPGWKEPGPPESFEGYVPKEGSGAPARFED